VLLVIGLPVVLYIGYQFTIMNPRVVKELTENPAGETAGRVMLLTLSDAKTIPVNYLQEGNKVYVGADGPWWRELKDGGKQVRMLIKGQELSGHATAIVDDMVMTHDVFARLRPAAPAWLPDRLNGVLVVVTLLDSD